jgi:hypothetical protein
MNTGQRRRPAVSPSPSERLSSKPMKTPATMSGV